MTKEEAFKSVEELSAQFPFASVTCNANTLQEWRVTVYAQGSYTLTLLQYRTVETFLKAFEARSWQVRTTGQ